MWEWWMDADYEDQRFKGNGFCFNLCMLMNSQHLSPNPFKILERWKTLSLHDAAL